MTSKPINIKVHPVTRVEGHGHIDISFDGKEIKKIEWNVPEAPRFF
jgi:sulfhydrogenase subunit alpha